VSRFDWRSRTENPVDEKVVDEMRRYLLTRRVVADVRVGGHVGFLQEQCRGKRVLDIGMGDHSMEFVKADRWKHRRLREAAAHILGIDILDGLVSQLAAQGYNVRKMDALSDSDLGERFDVVVCGEVIEHVDDPVRLVKFAKRHLAPGGRILMSTPNPFYWLFIREAWRRDTCIANFEHVSWISPSMALEIGERAGVELARYYVFDGCTSMWKRLLRRCLPVEFTTMEFLYEFH
jgi:2-polyprenyl-3-methyl-5-hydroxy-6-metoxy-1,4-benzoquinol methylase